MSDIEIFPAAARARREISRRAYLLFAAGALLLGCGAAVIGVSFASGSRPQDTWLLAATGLGCAGSGGLLSGLATLFRLRQPIQVEVTPYRLIWREGKKVAVMEYDEVERVDLVRGKQRKSQGQTAQFPVVRFIENDGEMVEFETNFDDRGLIHYSRFDGLSIAAAVLPHVRPHAVIHSLLDEFIQTGQVDVDSLPER